MSCRDSRKGKKMYNADLFSIDEEVLIKAKVANVRVEKDKILYRLKDAVTGQPYPYEFAKRDIIQIEQKGEEDGNETI